MKKDSIALIGFMATGKTVIGKALVRQLGNEFKFLETDEIVIKLAGKSIPKIFSEDGEAVFRHYEIEACRKVSKLSKVVISCGGGVVLNLINIENLKKNCYLVLLNASIEEICKRIKKDGIHTRPMINTTEPFEEIRKILAFRQPLYDSTAADIVIDTTGKSENEIVSLILAKIKGFKKGLY
ncbi:MAG: shikimate kinase [Candidatus Thorarchaeota archaeon]